MNALPKLAKYSKGSSMELLDGDKIKLIDYNGRQMIVRWNEEKGEYFRDNAATEALHKEAK
jgi:hypothetical protein